MTRLDIVLLVGMFSRYCSIFVGAMPGRLRFCTPWSLKNPVKEQ